MTDHVYEQLAKALDRLPNGFPRTPSNIEIALLRRIFSLEEATLAAILNGHMEPVDLIAKRVHFSVDETAARLKKLTKRGLLWFTKEDGALKFRLAPFVVGIYEAQLDSMDSELAELVEKYLTDGGAAGIMKYDPAIHRVLPAAAAVNAEWVLPYDDVRRILENAKTFSVRDCICRVQRSNLGHKCDFPIDNCLSFGFIKRPKQKGDISREEAMALLYKSEEIGLVHSVSNVAAGVGYICNCCGCCCALLRGITEWGIEKSVAYANYYAVVDPDQCQACGTCIERCQVDAISDEDDFSVVTRELCIGCGLCVTGCPSDAVQLHLKPEAEIVHPPDDFTAWEKQRLQNRGLAE